MARGRTAQVAGRSRAYWRGLFRVKITPGRAELVRLFGRDIPAAFKDYTKLWPRIAMVLSMWARRIYSSRSDADDGTPWKPWSPDYAKYGHKRKKSEDLLWRSGKMLGQLFDPTRGTIGWGPMFLSYGTKAKYSLVHCFGKALRRRRVETEPGVKSKKVERAGIPMRKFWGPVTSAMRADIDAKMTEYVREQLEIRERSVSRSTELLGAA